MAAQEESAEREDEQQEDLESAQQDFQTPPANRKRASLASPVAHGLVFPAG
jgi:hypothetical protein